MGDPETEAVLPRVQSDLVALLEATAKEKLAEETIAISPNAACTVMAVSGGYPEAYEKGIPISGLETVTDAVVFHAGTTEQQGTVVTNGGRVLAVTGVAPTAQEALATAYKQMGKISFDKSYYRTDIGKDIL